MDYTTKKFVPNAVKTIASVLNTEVEEDERVEGILLRNLDNTGECKDTDHMFSVEIGTYLDRNNREISRYFVNVYDEHQQTWLTHTPQTILQLTQTLQRVVARFGASL